MSQKSRYWEVVVYPDSLCDNWIEVLEKTALPIAISPLHDMDINENGEFKKPHYHVLFAFNGPTTQNNIIEIISKCDRDEKHKCPRYAEYKGNVVKAYEYHIHLNHPLKHPYEDNDRILINGFNVEDFRQLTNDEEDIVVKDIMKIINDEKIISLNQLLILLSTKDNILFHYAITHNNLFNNMIKSLFYEKYMLTNKK